MQRFTELQIWRRGHELALHIYRVTSGFPREERLGMVAQIGRASVSATSNIAEGAKRKSQREYAHFLNMAEGSLAETESRLRLSRDLNFNVAALINPLIAETDEISRMVCALRLSVEATLETAASNHL
jgi:four helix bundle protein